jgi:hypothetical protein
MSVRALIPLLALVLSSCASSEEDNRQRFIHMNDDSIGHTIIINGDTPYRVLETADLAIKNYIYRDKKGGEWMRVVELQIIKSWKFLSNQDLCVSEIYYGPS